jgi:tRNA(adenine34) deaminase
VPNDEDWMKLALSEADAAARLSEVPVGAVLVGADGTALARGHNLRETLFDPTAHAEMVALRGGSRQIRSWRLDGATLFVTLEPCAMCAGALILARVKRVVFGCVDPKAGALVSLYELGKDTRLNHRFEVTGGVLGNECSERLSSFFANLRAQGRTKT